MRTAYIHGTREKSLIKSVIVSKMHKGTGTLCNFKNKSAESIFRCLDERTPLLIPGAHFVIPTLCYLPVINQLGVC